MTGAEEILADYIRKTAENFNDLVDRAQSLGLSVTFGLSRFSTDPEKTHISSLIVERPRRWAIDR